MASPERPSGRLRNPTKVLQRFGGNILSQVLFEGADTEGPLLVKVYGRDARAHQHRGDVCSPGWGYFCYRWLVQRRFL